MGEPRMLIDGKLVEGEHSATFENINPATEQVLGPVADATAADMGRAIAAARVAFDTTSWSTDHAFRAASLHQLQAAVESEQEELRAELVAEVGCPVLLTYGPQLDAPLRSAAVAGGHDRAVRMATRAPAEGRLRHGHGDGAGGVAGAGRGRGRDRPVELPDRDHPQQARSGARHGQHVRAQAGPRHPLERHPPRPPHRREDRHPAGRGQHRRVVRPPRRRGAHHLPWTWSPSQAPLPPGGGSWRQRPRP